MPFTEKSDFVFATLAEVREFDRLCDAKMRQVGHILYFNQRLEIYEQMQDAKIRREPCPFCAVQVDEFHKPECPVASSQLCKHKGFKIEFV